MILERLVRMTPIAAVCLGVAILPAAPAAAVTVGEAGQVTVTDSIDQGVFETVNLRASYTDPVVVAFLQTRNDPQSAAARVRNVTTTSFEVFLQRPNGGAHTAAETVSYLVVEAGRQVLVSGLVLEAGTTSLSSVHREGEAYAPSPVAFSAAFDATPVLIHSLASHSGGFMASAVTSVDAAGFSAQLEAGGSGAGATAETLAWIAVADVGSFDCASELLVGRGSDGSADGVDDSAHRVDLPRPSCPTVAMPDAAVASGNSTGDADGYWARGGGIASFELSLFAEEDQVADSERSHADETFAWVAFTTPLALSTGAAVVWQFDSVVVTDDQDPSSRFVTDMFGDLRQFSNVDAVRAAWDWNLLDINADLRPGGSLVFFSSPVASVAAWELRDAETAETVYEIGIDNLWTRNVMEAMFGLSPALRGIGVVPLSIDHQLLPYDPRGVAVRAAGGSLLTTVDQPGGLPLTDTQLTLADASTLSAGDRLRVDGEILEVAAVDPNLVDITVVRGSEGTAAAAHDDGRRVYAVEPRSDWFGSTLTVTTAEVDAAATTLPVALAGVTPEAGGRPIFADGDVIRLFDETIVVSCPSGACGNDLSVTRGVQGTTAAAHDAGTMVKRFLPVEQWTLDHLVADEVRRGAGSIDFRLTLDVLEGTFDHGDLFLALGSVVDEFLDAAFLAVADDAPVAYDQSVDVDFASINNMINRWTYTSRLWFDSEAGYVATVALFNDPVAFNPNTLNQLLDGFGTFRDIEVVYRTATCRPDTSWANQERQCITTVPTERDLSITQTDGVTQAVPGESLTYTITATNDGLANPSVRVSDSFPAALTCSWTSVATGGATGNTSGSGDLADSLDMPALSSVTYTADCAIDPAATGTLGNSATISSPEDDFDPDNDSATDDDTVLVPAAGVSVTKTDGIASAVPGQSVTYTIVAANAGPSTAAGALVADTFAADTACSWTAVATGGAGGHTGGAGDLSQTLTLPPASSVTYTAVCAIDPAATGTLSNTATIASAIDSTPADNSATDDDTVLVPAADVSITKTDGVAEVLPGGTTTYTLVVANAGPSLTAADAGDVFPTDLACSWTSVAAGGASGNTDGSGDLADSLTLPPASSVTYTADCAIDPAATGTLSNTATISAAIDSTPVNNSATDDDRLATPPDFAKAFSPSAIAEDAASTLTFSIDNTANALAITGLAFTDNLPAGLLVAPAPAASTTCTGGTVTAEPGAATLGYAGGTVAATAACTVSVDVTGAVAGSYPNVSSALSSAAGTGSPATATLVILEPPAFAKSFAPDALFAGRTSTLTFTVDNSANPAATTGLAFTDELPAGLAISVVPGVTQTCTGGTVTAAAGGTSIGYAGGTVAAAGVCTVQVDVTAATPGTYVNDSSILSSAAGTSIGNGAQAFAWAVPFSGGTITSGNAVALDSAGGVISAGDFQGTVDVDPGPGVSELTAAAASPYVVKLDSSGDLEWAAAALGGLSASALDVAVDGDGNVLVGGSFVGTVDFDPGPGTFELTSGIPSAFVWKLDAAGGLVWAVSLAGGVSGSGTTGLAVDGDGNVHVTGLFGDTVDFDPGPGIVELTSGGADDAFVWKLDSAGELVWAHGFGGITVDRGNQLVVDEAGNVYAVGEFKESVDFDPGPGTHVLDAGSSRDVFVLALDAAGDFLWAAATESDNSASGHDLAVDDVGVTFAGRFNGTVDVDPGPGIFELTSTGGTDVLIVRLTRAGGFAWARWLDGEGTLNSAEGVAVDPAGNLVVAVDFHGTVDFDPGPGTFELVDPGLLSTAILRLDAAGDFLWAGALSSDRFVDSRTGGSPIAVSPAGTTVLTGNFAGSTDFDPGPGTAILDAGASRTPFVARLAAAGARDTLVANPAPGFAKSFAADTIAIGGESTLTFTIDNSASTLAAANLAFMDEMPAGVAFAANPAEATTCAGGLVTVTGNQLSLDSGSVAAGTTCAVQVEVTSSTAGAHLNTSGNLTSTAGSSGEASATLTVLGPPGFSKAFVPNSIADQATSTLNLTIDNTANLAAVTGLAFTDPLPAGLTIAIPSGASDTCAGILTAPEVGTAITYTGGSVAGGATCTVSVEVTGGGAGSHLNTTTALTSAGGDSGSASATLTVGAVIDVTGTGDVVATDGVCTLREALTNANNNADTTGGDCAAGAGHDAILVPAGTYLLAFGGADDDLNASGDLDVTDAAGLTLLGAGARTTIVDGGAAGGVATDRVFDVQPGAALDLEGLTVQNGSLSPPPPSNFAPPGKVLGDGGGGIRSRGTLELTAVRIHGNASPGDGGGLLLASGTATIRRCLFDANLAHTAAGATGGAIAVGVAVVDSVILEHSTLSGNIATSGTGGALSHAGILDVGLSYVTVTANSSGVALTGPGLLALESSIVTGNGAADCLGAVTSGGYNVFGSAGDAAGCPPDASDVVPSGGPGTVVDPLADNGGPTYTHGVYFGSPAIDLVPPAINGCGDSQVEDQRGQPRPDSGSCEAGAYEGAAVPVELISFSVE